jgi:hypothetical protein
MTVRERKRVRDLGEREIKQREREREGGHNK